MGIQFKQIDNLQSTFDSLSGDFQGQITVNDSGISNILSGSSSIGGWKYFTGNADFSGAQGILVDPNNIYTPNNIFAGGIRIGGGIATPRTSTTAPVGSFQVTGGQSYFDDQVNVRNSAGILISNGAITGGSGSVYNITGDSLSYLSGSFTSGLTVNGNEMFNQAVSGVASEGSVIITSGSGNFNAIDFNTAVSSVPHQEGRLFYDNDHKSLSIYNDESDVALQIGQEQYLRVRNDGASTITNGQAVVIDGSDFLSVTPTVRLASANSNDNSQTVGLVTHDIEASSYGYVTTYGIVRGVNTSVFSAGDEIFLAVESGALTGTAPTAPNYRVNIGHVVRDHTTEGTILCQPSIQQLGGGDVKSNNSVNVSGIGFFNSAAGNDGVMASQSTFIYNSGSSRLGIGTASPQGILDLSTTVSAPILPRLSDAQMNAISPAVNGMMIYNASSGKFAGYAGSAWVLLH